MMSAQIQVEMFYSFHLHSLAVIALCCIMQILGDCIMRLYNDI